MSICALPICIIITNFAVTQSNGTLSETDTDSDIVFESNGRSKASNGVALRKHDPESGGSLGSGLNGSGGSGSGKSSRTSMTRLGRRLRT